MKNTILIMLMIILGACKVETQKVSNPKAAIALSDSQIGISSGLVSSEQINQFGQSIEERQAAEPNKIFEVVNTDQLSGKSTLLSAISDDQLYPNRNFYIFLGFPMKTKDNETIQHMDWEAIYHIMNNVSKLKYRVLINVNATAEHLRMAAEDDKTAVILWSSHGNAVSFADTNGQLVPSDVFKNKSKNFYQFILSSCHGKTALEKNYDIRGLRVVAWTEKTDSIELEKYLISDVWSPENGKSLIPSKEGITCTANGKKIALMQSNSRALLYGNGFNNLNDCQKRISTLKEGKICSTGPNGIRKVNTNNLSLSEKIYGKIDECINE